MNSPSMLSKSGLFLASVILISTMKLANAQVNKLNTTASNFQPSLFVVIGVLSFMFSLTFILLLYAKMCYQQPSAIHVQSQEASGGMTMFGIHTRFSGLDVDVVEALPFFRFSSLKGAKQGLQCSVCLAEFDDVEILRLLPKCKHGFHIECIDQWLQSHSTCPLCRQKVSIDDIINSNNNNNNNNSMRFIAEAGKSGSDSNLEIFIEREDNDGRSSRFNSIGGSFRRFFTANINNKEEVVKPKPPPMESGEKCNLHRLNHQIVVSDVVFKNRWSDVSSSDLMFLNSEMLGIMSSDRISSSNKNQESGNDHGSSSSTTMSIKEEMERKMTLDQRFGQYYKRSDYSNSSSKTRTGSYEIESGHPRARAMSEITGVSRFKDVRSMKNKLRQCFKEPENCCNDEMNRRRKWFPIAKRTVQWFANRENNRFQMQMQMQVEQHPQGTRTPQPQITLDV